MHAEAEVAKHFGGPALSDADVDRTPVKPDFVGRQARHRGKKSDPHTLRLLGDGHPLGCSVPGRKVSRKHDGVERFPFGIPGTRKAEWSTVERLLVRVGELKPASPPSVPRDARHDKIDVNVAEAG